MEHKKKKRYFNFIFYLAFVIVYLYVVSKYGMGNENSRIRYYILVLVSVLGILSLILFNLKEFQERGINSFKEKKLLLVIPVTVLFYIISMYRAKMVYMKLNVRTYVQILLFLLPTIYAFIAVNIFSKEEIVELFKLTTIALIVTYFSEPSHTIAEFFNFDNWLQISFGSSSSFTESHICARAFCILFLFFYYLYKTDNKKSSFKYMIITLIFTILCFKRIDIIICVFTIIMGRFIKFDKKVKLSKIIVFTAIIVGLTVLYIEFLKGKVFQNINAYTFTSGRNMILALWEKKNYLSYGYGTSLLVLNRYLELDLVEMFMELNAFALISFVFVYLYIAKNSKFTVYIMLYVLFNMLMASSLANTLAWVLLMTSVAFISDNTKERMEQCNGNSIESGKKIL